MSNKKVKLIWVTPDAENLLTYIARVSNPANQQKQLESENPEQMNSRLIRYLIEHKHWSPFEQVNACFEINTTRAISAQILRHRSFAFQEFCITGDSKITTLHSNGQPNYIEIKKLYERQRWGQYKNIKLRVFDEKTKEFTSAPFLEVFKTGVKPIFKVTFEDGKTIKTTKEHKFLTRDGFESLEEALGLEIRGATVTQKNPKLLAVNGAPAYQDYEILKSAKEKAIKNKTGLQGIADEFSVSTHTIRKWLKRNNLCFSKKEVAFYTEIWNKGKTGYSLKPRTREQKEYMRNITPKGEKHHAYRGGHRHKRKAVCNFFKTHRKDIFEKYNYTCQMCFKHFSHFDGKIDLHHIKEFSLHPELAFDLSNIIPVHRKCHMEYHGRTYYLKEKCIKGKGNRLVPKFKKVVSVEYVGEEETYDIHVDHPSHNYVANKIVVHNSQRYSTVDELGSFETPEVRYTGTSNRQASLTAIEANKEDRVKFDEYIMESAVNFALDSYKSLINNGVAPESARMVLPMCSPTRLYLNGSLRSWIHYLQVRNDPAHTQKEHVEIAKEIDTQLAELFPLTWKALNN